MLPLYPSGHYHSTIPSVSDLKRGDKRFPYKGIQIDWEAQLDLLNDLSSYYAELPFDESPSKATNYFYQNNYFSYSDAIVLFCMMNHFKPGKIIELGSGLSTACVIDSILHSKLSTRIRAFDLDDSRVREFIPESSSYEFFSFERIDIRDIDIEVFQALESADILFIDSSHVSKYNSDLNHILFEILPCLKPGVLIHFHDVFRNFEYPPSWIEEGIYWNEQYMLRAFLQYNNDFEVMLFSDEMESRYTNWYQAHMPDCLKAHERHPHGENKGELISDIRGQSLWLRKVASK